MVAVRLAAHRLGGTGSNALSYGGSPCLSRPLAVPSNLDIRHKIPLEVGYGRVGLPVITVWFATDRFSRAWRKRLSSFFMIVMVVMILMLIS